MNAATELLVRYAADHRDRRNIATQFVGVPLIVFALGALLARPSVEWGGWPVTPAAVVWGLTALWYLTRGNLALGVATCIANLALVLAALPLGQLTTASWLAWGVGAFLAGWAIRWLGHYYEGRKPTFVDEIRAMLNAPMFIVAQTLFALGWGRTLLAQVEARVGPPHLRDLHAPATR